MTHITYTSAEIASKIDHTLLKPTMTIGDLEKLCSEARHHRFKTVCIPPSWIRKSIDLLKVKGCKVETITVVGFPLGYSHPHSKAEEAKRAIDEDATEIDMVLNVSFLKSGMTQDVGRDIAAVVKACGKTPVKVILETAYLTNEEKVKAARIAEAEGARYIKTSTGFATNVDVAGATLADIRLLRENLKPGTLIKASGGIRDMTTALAMLNAGADRLGTSSGVAILKGIKGESSY